MAGNKRADGESKEEKHQIYFFLMVSESACVRYFFSFCCFSIYLFMFNQHFFFLSPSARLAPAVISIQTKNISSAAGVNTSL